MSESMPVPTLVIGNKNYSSWSLRPWLLLSHFEIAFSEVKIMLFQEDTRAKLAPWSPTLRVPVLKIDDHVIWDSLSIVEYISEQFLNGKGWPANAVARSQARSVCAEMHSGFSELRNQWPMNCRLQRKMSMNDGLAKDIFRVDEIWQSCLGTYGGEQGYLFNEFSIADCFFAPVVMRFYSYQPELSEVSHSYMQHMLKNASLRSWIEEGIAEKEMIKEDEIDFL